MYSSAHLAIFPASLAWFSPRFDKTKTKSDCFHSQTEWINQFRSARVGIGDRHSGLFLAMIDDRFGAKRAVEGDEDVFQSDTRHNDDDDDDEAIALH